MKNKAIFLDRDGVINVEKSYIRSPKELIIYNHVAHSVHKLKQAGFLVIMITNQSGIARGYLTEKTLKAIHRKIEKTLSVENTSLDGIYYCPHHPKKGAIHKYIRACDCRKPKPGMLIQAAIDFNIDLSKSYFLGDSDTDMIAAKSANCAAVGVKQGHKMDESKCDYLFENLEDFTNWLLSNIESKDK